MAFPHDYMYVAAGAPAGGVPSRCGVPIRRSGGRRSVAMRRSDPALRRPAFRRDAAFRSGAPAAGVPVGGTPVRRCGKMSSRYILNLTHAWYCKLFPTKNCAAAYMKSGLAE